MQSELLTLKINADPLTQQTCGLTIPSDGVIQWIRINFPMSKNVVQARAYINGFQVVPSRGDSLIDNGPVDVPIGQAVNEGDHFMLWIGNPDSSGSHLVSASVLLEKSQSNSAYGMSGAVVQPIQIPEEAQRQGNQGGNNAPTPAVPGQGQGASGEPGTGPGDQGQGPGQSLGGIPSNVAGVSTTIPGAAQGQVSQIPKLTPQAPMRPNVHNVPTYPSVYGGIYPQDVGGVPPQFVQAPNSIYVDSTSAALFVFGLLLIFVLLVVILKEKKS